MDSMYVWKRFSVSEGRPYTIDEPHIDLTQLGISIPYRLDLSISLNLSDCQLFEVRNKTYVPEGPHSYVFIPVRKILE